MIVLCCIPFNKFIVHNYYNLNRNNYVEFSISKTIKAVLHIYVDVQMYLYVYTCVCVCVYIYMNNILLA